MNRSEFPPLYVRIPPSILRDLRREAKERRLSLAQLVAEILARRYERPTGPVRT